MFGRACNVSAQVLYAENFDDEILPENTMVVNGTIANGFLSLDDPAAARASFSVVQNLTNEVMTFSFDVVEPVVQTQDPTRMEVVLRAGVGTAHNTLQNADQVVESIIFRGGNRGAYVNNGNETIFLVANNKASDLTFESPIDGAPVTLTGFQYIPYVQNHDTNMFGQIKGISAFNGGQRPFERFAIGSSTTGDVGTFAIDNVLVVSGVSFEQVAEPMCVLGDTDCNNMVNFADFEPIRANFRKLVGTRVEGDLVRDGVVDFDDFHEWKTAFLGVGGSLADFDFGFLASVPEPSAALLMLLGGAALLCYQGRRRGRSACA
jgi:hypothetical protein